MPVLCGSHSSLTSYDADGNVTSSVRHFDGNSDQTIKWYDGADRLVEVEQPADANVNGPSLTRYIYDLSQGGNEQFHPAVNLTGHGNLVKIQQCLPITAPCRWFDIKAQSYDALDRETAHYEYQPDSNGETPMKTTLTYDQGVNVGFAAATTNAINQTTTYGYDAAGRRISVAFSDGTTPNRTYTYDADGRTASILSSAFGEETLSYDADGNVVAHKDASQGGVTGASTISYEYYPTGWRKDLSITSTSPQMNGRTLFKYAYRVDGARVKLVSDLSRSAFTWAYTRAGRMLSQTDPATGATLVGQNGLPSSTLRSRTFTYDTYGEVSSLALPAGGQYNNIQHNVEGLYTKMDVAYPGFNARSVARGRGWGHIRRLCR